MSMGDMEGDAIIAARERALEAKDAGNLLFELGDWEGASVHFTEGIEADPSFHVLFSNRSACHMKLGSAVAALADADACVRLQPGWAKGHTRRGAALLSLMRYDEAHEAFVRALAIEPENAAALAGLEDVRTAAAAASSASAAQLQAVHTVTAGGATVSEDGRAFIVREDRVTRKRKFEEVADDAPPATPGDECFAAAAAASREGHLAPESVHWLEDAEKRKTLLGMLLTVRAGAAPARPCLVLVESAAAAETLAAYLARKAVAAVVAITEKQPAHERLAALAARYGCGADVKVASFAACYGAAEPAAVRRTVLYDLPSSMPAYLLLSNQTARFGRGVDTTTFVNNDAAQLFTALAENWVARGVLVPAQVANSPFCKAAVPRAPKRRPFGEGGGERVAMLGAFS